uniref:Ribonuclease n=1 Tax=Ornithodoros turicata TaxID=34597 RepID=A0A2R5LH18_9ACAR
MNFEAFHADNKNNAVVVSAVPEATKQQPCMLGIDEAGRGPVLGPMVYACAYCPLKDEQSLKELGFADSKTLTEGKREELFKEANNRAEWLGWMLRVISPTVICNSMLNICKYSLNAVSHEAAMALIRGALDSGVNVKQVYVDTVGPVDKYQAKLEAAFPDLTITVAKKADATFPIVSAASICAKVARDNVTSQWYFPEGISDEDYGSGYPGDPVTQKFLLQSMDSVFGFSSFVRFSWMTADKILQERASAVSWPKEDESGQSIRAFLKRCSDGTSKAAPKSQFFEHRLLHQVTSL